MGNFDFLDEDLLNLKGTTTYEKREKFLEGLENFIDSKETNDKTINEAYKNKELVLQEELNLAFYERFNKVEEVSQEEIALKESALNNLNEANELFMDVLAESVVRALNIDEKLVEANRSEIVTKVKDFYTEMADYIDLEASPVVYDLVKRCSASASSFDIEKRDALFEEADKIALIVKEKVARVIEEEKNMSKVELMKEENAYSTSVDIDLTLFKEMEITNVKQAIQECADRELDKNTIMLMSFYETIVDYTLVETFNTLKMLHFNEEMYLDSSRKTLIDLGF